jgi:hypothetical protein
MPRKATDLLDVFHAQRQQESGKAAARAREEAPARKGFTGVVLLPRHVLLGSSVVVLLLVFSFVLGLGMGQRKGAGESGTRLSVEAPRGPRYVYAVGRVPLMDPARQALNDPQRLKDTLVRQRGLPANRVDVFEDLGTTTLRIMIGPFGKEADAADYLTRAGLFTYRLGGVAPWRDPEYRWMTEDELAALRSKRR